MIYIYVIVGMCSSFLLSLALLLFYLRYKRNILQQQFQIQVNELEYQKKLTQVIITSQEQERKRIGKELHDDVGNSLAALRLYLDKYMYLPDNSNVMIREEYNKRIGNIFNKLRTISHQLSVSEIELFGLKEAILMLCDHIEQSDKFVIHIDESRYGIPESLEYNTSVMIYRVFQELLTNTIKHADANEVTISFEHQATSGNMMICYSDNGKGLDADTAHQGFGFKNIESRLQAVNGYYEIDHAAGFGFSIKIFIPQDQLIAVPAAQVKSLQS